MRKIVFVAIAFLALVAAQSCQNKKTAPVIGIADSTAVDEDQEPDSTLYGVCGEGTGMHSLQFIADSGDTLTVLIPDDDPAAVQGGLLCGDRLAVIADKTADGDLLAKKVINLTSLLGKWTSIDKNFDIVEGGEVVNNVKAETNPWTTWKIVNGKLLLNKDTFAIDVLGPDSLLLENNQGIYAFKRQTKD